MWRERFGSSGVAAAVDGSSGAGPAVGDQSEGRACVRAGAQTWRAHLRGHQRGRGGRASGRWRTSFEFTPLRRKNFNVLLLTVPLVVSVKHFNSVWSFTLGSSTPGG